MTQRDPEGSVTVTPEFIVVGPTEVALYPFCIVTLVDMVCFVSTMPATDNAPVVGVKVSVTWLV